MRSQETKIASTHKLWTGMWIVIELLGEEKMWGGKMLRSNKTQYLKIFSINQLNLFFEYIGHKYIGTLSCTSRALGLGKGLAPNMFGALGSKHQ